MNVTVNVYGPPRERPKPPRFEDLSLSDQLDKIELATLQMATQPDSHLRARTSVEIFGYMKKVNRNALSPRQKAFFLTIVEEVMRTGFGIDPIEVP